MVKTSPFNAGGVGSIPGWGAKIPHALRAKKPKNIKQKQYCNKFNKGFKSGPHQKKKSLKKKKEIFIPVDPVNQFKEIEIHKKFVYTDFWVCMCMKY